MDPTERVLRARIGAHALRDARETTAAGRRAFLARFLDEVDPDRVLSEPERLKRAEQAKKAYFTRLALESAKSRRRKIEAKTNLDSARLSGGAVPYRPSAGEIRR